MFYHEPPVVRPQYREVLVKTALNRVTGMGFGWSLNPYQGCVHSCVYCFARAHAKLADRDPGEGFSTDIAVKVNLPQLLRQELSRRSWRHERVAFGTATDPYQPIEGRYRLTRRCLEAFRDSWTPVGLITKGTMVIRDVDVLVELAGRTETTVCFSVPTVDEEVWRRTEPGTPPPRQRLRALRQLVSAGITAGVGMAPILPGISDAPAQLEATVAAAADAGAAFVWANPVYLKPGTREYFFEFLDREYPHLRPSYDRLFPGAYVPARYKTAVQQQVGRLRDEHRVGTEPRPARIQPVRPTQLALIP
jgi:DNA repair photolyase